MCGCACLSDLYFSNGGIEKLSISVVYLFICGVYQKSEQFNNTWLKYIEFAESEFFICKLIVYMNIK